MDVQLDWFHYLLLAASGVSLGTWLFRKDTEVENRRRAAAKAAGELRSKYGLTMIPSMLEDYSVGDYSGVASRVKDISELLLDPKRSALEFDEIFKRLLTIKMGQEDSRNALIAEVQRLATANGVEWE